MTDTGPTPSGPAPTPNPGLPPSDPTLAYATPADNAYMGPAPTSDDRTMGMLCHLLAIFTGFIGPLIIWLIKKDQSPFVSDQGREALNFQLTVLIGWVVSAVASFFCIGFILAIAVFVGNLIFCIMGAMKANSGIAYRYPFNIRLIK